MPEPNASDVPVAPATMLEEALEHKRSWRERLPAIVRGVRAVLVEASGLKSEPITVRAAALTFLTVLAIVPLLAVVFSLFQAIVGTQALQAELERFVINNLAVGTQASFQRYIEQDIRKATGAALGGIGFVLLVGSSVSLLVNIESAFNRIFRSSRRRPLGLRIGVYWSLLTLGPILLSVSLALTALLGARAGGPLRHLAGYLLPFLVTVTGFTLLYVILPTAPVKRRSALLGAIVAGALWEIAKVGYAMLSAHAVRRDALYGSISAVPTFLLWTYVSWVIVLFGARIAYAAQATALSPDGEPPAPLARELFVARVMRGIALAFHQGSPCPTAPRLAEQLSEEEPLVRSALADLEGAGLARELAEGGWVPARPLSRIRLSEVRAAARGDLQPGSAPPAPLPVDLADLAQRWAAADAAAGQRLDVTLGELVGEPDRAAASSADGP